MSGDRIIYLSVHYNRTVLTTAVDVMCVVSVHVVCRTDRLTLLDTYQFNDSANEFEREPYCVKFSLHNTGEPAEGGRLQKLEGGLAQDYGVLKTEPWLGQRRWRGLGVKPLKAAYFCIADRRLRL